MPLFWKINLFRVLIKSIFVVLFLVATNSLMIEPIKGVEGPIHDIEFDWDSNAYGLGTQYKILKEPCPSGPTNDSTSAETKYRSVNVPVPSFLFKLDANKTLLWKKDFNHEQTPLSIRAKIFINRKNDVYVITKINGTQHDVYMNQVREGNPVVKKILRFVSHEIDPHFESIFLVDNKIITVDSSYVIKFPSEKESGNAEKPKLPLYLMKTFMIKSLNTHSGKQSIVAISSKKKPLIVKDKKDDIYFTVTSEGTPSKQELVALTKNSLKKENPILKKILEVDPQVADIIDLRVGENNELYIGIHYESSSRLQVKKFSDDKLTTIFKRSGIPRTDFLYPLELGIRPISYISLLPVKNGVVVKTCSSSLLSSLSKISEPGFGLDLNLEPSHAEMDFTYMDANESILPLRNHRCTANETNFDKCNTHPDFCYQDEALEDEQGNVFFEGADFFDTWGDGTRLLMFNRTARTVVKIQFQPGLNNNFIPSLMFHNTAILLDAKDNVWFLSHYFDEGYYDILDSHLYFLEKGSSVAQRVPHSENFTRIIKSKDGQVFILSRSALFVTSLN